MAKTKEKLEIKPCYKCGRKAKAYERWVGSPWGFLYATGCRKCKVGSPAASREETTIKSWNRKVDRELAKLGKGVG